MGNIAKLQVVGRIALLETPDFDIEVIGTEHQIKMKVEDKGGYKEVIAERLLPHVIAIIDELL